VGRAGHGRAPCQSRGPVTILLARILEDQAGLRFSGPPIPFCGFAKGQSDGSSPLGGYAPAQKGYSPGAWVADFYARWHAHQDVLSSHADAGLTQAQVEADSRYLEAARLIRAALSHCMDSDAPDAVQAAVQFVAEIAGTGQARDHAGSALAVSVLLRAGAASDDPRSLTRYHCTMHWHYQATAQQHTSPSRSPTRFTSTRNG
jgi:hypothetical protein